MPKLIPCEVTDRTVGEGCSPHHSVASSSPSSEVDADPRNRQGDGASSPPFVDAGNMGGMHGNAADMHPTFPNDHPAPEYRMPPHPTSLARVQDPAALGAQHPPQRFHHHSPWHHHHQYHLNHHHAQYPAFAHGHGPPPPWGACQLQSGPPPPQQAPHQSSHRQKTRPWDLIYPLSNIPGGEGIVRTLNDCAHRAVVDILRQRGCPTVEAVTHWLEQRMPVGCVAVLQDLHPYLANRNPYGQHQWPMLWLCCVKDKQLRQRIQAFLQVRQVATYHELKEYLRALAQEDRAKGRDGDVLEDLGRNLLRHPEVRRAFRIDERTPQEPPPLTTVDVLHALLRVFEQQRVCDPQDVLALLAQERNVPVERLGVRLTSHKYFCSCMDLAQRLKDQAYNRFQEQWCEALGQQLHAQVAQGLQRGPLHVGGARAVDALARGVWKAMKTCCDRSIEDAALQLQADREAVSPHEVYCMAAAFVRTTTAQRVGAPPCAELSLSVEATVDFLREVAKPPDPGASPVQALAAAEAAACDSRVMFPDVDPSRSFLRFLADHEHHPGVHALLQSLLHPEEPARAAAVPDTEGSARHRVLTCLDAVLPLISSTGLAAAAEIEARLRTALGPQTFEMLGRSVWELLQDDGDPQVRTRAAAVQRAVGIGVPVRAREVLLHAGRHVRRCGHRREVAAEIMAAEFGVSEFAALNAGPVSGLLPEAAPGDAGDLMFLMPYLTSGPGATAPANPLCAPDDLLENAKAEVQSAPFLVSLPQYLQWDVQYGPVLGPLERFLLDHCQEVSLLHCEGAFMRIPAVASPSTFFDALRSSDGRAAAAHFLRLQQQQQQGLPAALLARHVQQLLSDTPLEAGEPVYRLLLGCLRALYRPLLARASARVCEQVRQVFVDAVDTGGHLQAFYAAVDWTVDEEAAAAYRLGLLAGVQPWRRAQAEWRAERRPIVVPDCRDPPGGAAPGGHRAPRPAPGMPASMPGSGTAAPGAAEVIEAMQHEYDAIVRGGDATLDRMERMLEVLAHDIHANEYHFMEELLQNADDNRYADGVTPAVVSPSVVPAILTRNPLSCEHVFLRHKPATVAVHCLHWGVILAARAFLASPHTDCVKKENMRPHECPGLGANVPGGLCPLASLPCRHRHAAHKAFLRIPGGGGGGGCATGAPRSANRQGEEQHRHTERGSHTRMDKGEHSRQGGGAQRGRRGNQNSGNREPGWRGWESVRMGGSDNKGDGLASQPRR